MKRALIALVAVGFVVAAVTIARANSGDDEPSRAKPIDVSRKLARDVTREQTKQQADQVLKAQAELAEKVNEFSEDVRSRPLTITVREERPGDVWVYGEVAGKPACVTPPTDVPTYLTLTGSDGPLQTEVVPLEAKRLENGACETTIKAYLPRQDWYEVSIKGAGHGTFSPVKVEFSDQPQKVTIVG
jgi:hypothetical protein